MKFFIFVTALALFVAATESRQENEVKNYYKKVDQKNLAAKKSGSCNDCMSTIRALKDVLQDEIKFKKLKDVLKVGCNYYVDESVEECKNTVNILDFYVDRLQRMLGDPEYTCRNTLMLCSGDERQYPIGTKGLMLALKIALKSTETAKFETPQCDDCVLVVNTLYAALEESGVQQAIKTVALKVCSLVKRHPLSDRCTEWVNDNLETVINNVLQKFSDPIGMCKSISICQSAPSSLQNVEHKALPLKELISQRLNRLHSLNHVLFTKLPNLKTPSGSAAGCEACKISLTTLDALLNTPTILKCVSFGLTELVCMKILPAPLNASCWDFLDLYSGFGYLPAVIEMTVNEWTPDQICTKMKACSASTSLLKQITVPKQQLASTGGCQACQTVTNFLTNEFQQQAFQQDIVDLIKSLICSHGSSTEAQCSSMVNQYIPFLMEQLTDFMSRDSFCSFLHLCPSSSANEVDFINWGNICAP